MTTESLRWYKSSYSGNGGQCIEVATNVVATRGVVPVRDSKDPGGPHLNLTARAFADLVAFAKSHD
ncbi:hypothetical protein ADL22_01815 [Streptomyces sp. NRRL F-4489]|uniref:DUF397 domain-containing protein n=1 Tax=Streptomyces sp. NRRL F-4489 TaxID=1609095 RepID=UPI000749534B|nr:DUF397 domain-containing protein [Streptomyces sp. NRRL F-4489]KUL55226.1 hypothetical protein ADL22_01815 [Streptomyces sp. NRRL F-4489]